MRWIKKVMTTPAEEIKTEEDLERSQENALSIIGVFDEYSGEIYEGFMGRACYDDRYKHRNR
jgi:hypothetical protein